MWSSASAKELFKNIHSLGITLLISDLVGLEWVLGTSVFICLSCYANKFGNLCSNHFIWYVLLTK